MSIGEEHKTLNNYVTVIMDTRQLLNKVTKEININEILNKWTYLA